MLIKTPEPQTVDTTVTQIKGIINRIYQMMKMNHTQAYNAVWNNPQYTPQEIITAFGADAIPLFQLSAALQDILLNADPGYVFLSPDYSISTQPDGSILLVPKNVPV